MGEQLLQFLISGLTNGAIYALIALGFIIIYNATEIINFAQGEFVMLGGMVMVTLQYHCHLPFFLAFLLTLMLVSIIGVSFAFLAIRPAQHKASLVSLIIITIGGSILFRGLAMFIWGKHPYPALPFSGDKPISILGACILPQSLWIIGITLVVFMFMEAFFRYTITGKAMRACAFNAKAASLMGINVDNMVLLSFGLSAALGALGGMLIAPITLAAYDMGTMLGLKGFCAAVLGGLGSSAGAVVGGLILGILEALAAGMISSGYRDAVAFVLLLFVLFVKPSGILGLAEVKRS